MIRLLNSSTYELNWFDESNTPEYAILSHTWGPDEVTFDQIADPSTAFTRSGGRKIQGCCQQAAISGIDWVWVDTCCIDKRSSAELSEAINSMYAWYRQSTVCYVYLDDIGSSESTQRNPDLLGCSRWFTRGWTLQELIAPRDAIFFDKKWRVIGTKATMSDVLSQITGIDAFTLARGDPSHMSVAQRMSWASQRETTRSEDMAYCLLGIFEINMPLLYGEGSRAFIRLQEEIIKESDDQSLFSWCNPMLEGELGSVAPPGTGMLAKHPSYFASCGNVVVNRQYQIAQPHAMTNRGLQITVQLIPTRQRTVFEAALGCGINQTNGAEIQYILLRVDPQDMPEGIEPENGMRFTRLHSSSLSTSSTSYFQRARLDKAPIRTVFIAKYSPPSTSMISLPARGSKMPAHSFVIRQLPSEFSIVGANPAHAWDPDRQVLITGYPNGPNVFALEMVVPGVYLRENTKHCALILGFSPAWFNVLSKSPSEPLELVMERSRSKIREKLKIHTMTIDLVAEEVDGVTVYGIHITTGPEGASNPR